jgi:hypothetical protein
MQMNSEVTFQQRLNVKMKFLGEKKLHGVDGCEYFERRKKKNGAVAFWLGLKTLATFNFSKELK